MQKKGHTYFWMLQSWKLNFWIFDSFSKKFGLKAFQRSILRLCRMSESISIQCFVKYWFYQNPWFCQKRIVELERQNCCQKFIKISQTNIEKWKFHVNLLLISINYTKIRVKAFTVNNFKTSSYNGRTLYNSKFYE